MRAALRLDPRAGFFLAAAAACFLLAIVAAEYTHVAVGLGAVYVMLAVASWLDRRAREQAIERRRRRRARRQGVEPPA